MDCLLNKKVLAELLFVVRPFIISAETVCHVVALIPRLGEVVLFLQSSFQLFLTCSYNSKKGAIARFNSR